MFTPRSSPLRLLVLGVMQAAAPAPARMMMQEDMAFDSYGGGGGYGGVQFAAFSACA
jgi:hypothetical protein